MRITLFITLLLTGVLFTNFVNAADNRPNIMIIMVDDMGFSDPGCYGGEINTPNIDSLAYNGVRFTQFYNSSRCCPTRASMLTGLYAHQVGLKNNGQSLTTNCVTIAEALKTAGYNTGMTGKWHLSRTKARSNNAQQLEWLANRVDYGEFAPLETYPCNRGFDEHWGIIWGVANFFDPFSLVHNEERIDTVPDDFYLTNFITEKTLDLIDTFSTKEAPFFMYVAHAAPHWPLHALPEDIAKYDGKYDYGWDSLRIKRYNRMVDMGLIDPDVVPNASNESGTSWNSKSNKEWEADHFEVHAAMIDRVDQGIGDIIAKLKEKGEYDNTIIFFLSDNGASPERPNNAGFDRPGYTREGVDIKYHNEGFDAPGPELTFSGIGKPWSGASNTPWRYWKKESFHGGNCTPLIIHWPDGLKVQEGSITDYVGHVKDIMPTCLEAASVAYPETYKGNIIQPHEGNSLLPFINNEVSSNNEDTIFWEHSGGKAARAGYWKISKLNNGEWELFNLENDLSETTNLVNNHPQKLYDLVVLWNEWAQKVGLNEEPLPEVPVNDTVIQVLFHFPFDGNLIESVENYELLGPNMANYGSGQFGQALDLNGVDDYFDLNTSGIINTGTSPFTVCAWVHQTDSPQGNEENILHQLNGRIMLFNSVENGKSTIGSWIGGALYFASGNTFATGSWQHIAVSSSPLSRQHIFYVNGVAIDTLTANAFESNESGFRIGAHKNNKSYWHGKIDELYLYKGILAPEQIISLMNNEDLVTLQSTTIKQNFTFYPNPAKNTLTIISDDVEDASLTLLSIQGQILYSTLLQNKQTKLDISNYYPGTYFIQIQSGNNTIVQKFIKE